MANIDFKTLLESLKQEVTGLAVSTVNKYKDEAKADALKLVEDMKTNLENWTLQYAEGKLSQKDLEFLILGQKELIEMNALKHAGLAKVRADELKTGILNAVLKVVAGVKVRG